MACDFSCCVDASASAKHHIMLQLDMQQAHYRGQATNVAFGKLAFCACQHSSSC